MGSSWESNHYFNIYVLRARESKLQTTDYSLVNKTNVIGTLTVNVTVQLALHI